MSNPIDLCAITLNKALLIMSKGLRIQPLILVKSLRVFVEEVGERGILSDPGSLSVSSWVPAHSTVCALEEDAALGKSQLGCLQKGLCQTLTAINSQERVLWERDKDVNFENERLFYPPSPPAYHGEITANISKARSSCWHFPADSFLSPYTQENTRSAWLW